MQRRVLTGGALVWKVKAVQALKVTVSEDRAYMAMHVSGGLYIGPEPGKDLEVVRQMPLGGHAIGVY